MYGVGKITAISVTKKGLRLDTIDKVGGDIKQIEEATSFIVTCYGSKHDIVPSTHVGTEDGKKNHPCPPRCAHFLPPTTDTLYQNVLRCHHQRAQWYGALKSEPPVMNSIEFG